MVRNEKLDALYFSLDKANTGIKWMVNPKAGSIQNFVQRNYNLLESRSQLQQDLVAAFIHSLFSDEPGYFIEFGATDGKTYSNTYCLEKRFGWSGVLAEPAKIWHRELEESRSCSIDHRCVWSTSGTDLAFNEVSEAEYSTLETFSNSDYHSSIRSKGKSYFVQTVTLEELLKDYKAPSEISYLSVDTEGSEFEILRTFNFDSYKINFISVEHNFTDQRSLIHDLLVRNGYQRVMTKYSEWDDWYVRICKETQEFLEGIDE